MMVPTILMPFVMQKTACRKEIVIMKMDSTIICIVAMILSCVIPCGCGPAPSSEGDNIHDFQTVDTNVNVQVSEVRRKTAQTFGDHDIGNELSFLKSEKRIKIDGQVVIESNVKYREILALGGKALPGLIDAAENADVEIRVCALAAIFNIAEKEGCTVDMLPVFKRSLKDKDVEARDAAVRQIGNLCYYHKHDGNQITYLECLAILVDVVNGDDPELQYTAGLYLFRVGEEEKVPESTKDRFHLEEEMETIN